MNSKLAREVFAVIPARKGSVGIKNKNIKLIAGHPLIAYSIMAARLSGIKKIYVSTDSLKYKKIAESYGALVPFLRPKNISTKDSTDFDFILHFVRWLKKEGISFPKYLIHLRPTTPIRDPKVIKKAIKFIIGKKKSTSLRSGHISAETFMKWFYKNDKGYFEKVHKSMTAENIDKPRQKFRPVYIPNGYVDIYKPEFILKKKKLLGSQMLVFETPRCIEVDEIYDLNVIKSLKDKNKQKLLNFLNKIKRK